jgi:hypothetical protein
MLVNLAELEKITGKTFKTIKSHFDAANIRPVIHRGKGKSHFYESRDALFAIFHPSPTELNFDGHEYETQMEWKEIIARIRVIFAETPIKISRLGGTKKEQGRLFDQAQYVVDEIMGQFDLAVKL